MPWSGGNFTRANGNNGWVTDQTDGIGIEAGRHDTQDNDFKEGINFCLAKDGSNSATGNLNLGNNKITALATATATTDAMPYGMIRDGAPVYLDKTNNRLGIGTTTPVDTLEVASTSFFPQYISTYVNSAGGANIVVRRSRGATIGTNTILQNNDIVGSLGFQGANGSTFTQCAAIGCAIDGVPGATNDMPGRLTFETTADGSGIATERMRITSGGLVGINITAPVYRLQLGDDSAAKPTTNTWIIASDARLKTNIQNYSKGLAEICQLRPITYDYNGKGGFAAGPGGISIIAQEIQPIFPECVGIYKAKLNEDDAEDTEILNYNGHAITFALINAIKELNAKVEALESRVAALEA